MRVVGELIALEKTLACPKSTIPVWETCIAFLGWRTGSFHKLNAQKDLLEVMSHRLHIDNSIELVGKLLFGSGKASELLKSVRTAGQPLVDDWSCLKSMVRTFESHCGSLSQYGMKHMRSLANICNAGVSKETMAKVAAQACTAVPSNRWSSLHRGFTA
ncbi:hypothetical protein GW17_00017239 [Ensete ventricosum]|nr:hypothetical protein GW17_00017239 [Ensete ventricosum]